MHGAIPLSLPRELANYGLDFWRETEGLPQSRIRSIVQTGDGYIWLGTDGGAVRFNGTTFTAFTVETGSLKDNEVWALQEDDENALWIGTYGGGVTRLKDGVFKTFTTADGLPEDVITHIAKDRAGNLWISTPSALSRYSHGTFTSFTNPDTSNFGSLCAHSPERIFVATTSRVLSFSTHHFEPLEGAVQEGDGGIGPLVCATDGSLWISFSNSVIKRWKDGQFTTFVLDASRASQVTMLYQDWAGEIWAGFGRKVHKFKNGRFEPVMVEEGSADAGVLYSMNVDREGSVWLGLQSNGLGRLHVKQLSTLTTANGLPNDSTRSVFQDRRGAIWIGTARGFCKFIDGHVESYTMIDGRRLGAVRSFGEDPEQRLWVGAGEGLLVLKNASFVPVPGWRGSSEIEVIYKDSQNRMWVGTDGDGLYVFEGGHFTNYRTQDGLASNRIRAIHEDRKSTIWISTFAGGISKFQDGRLTRSSAGFGGKRVISIYEDEEGALWFTTRSGLIRLKDGSFFSYTSASGLLVDFIYAMLDDGKGNFWFSCAMGLFKVSKAQLRDFAEGRTRRITPESYGVRDGMKTRAFNIGNQPSAWKATDGTLLFASLAGVVVVAPGRITTNASVPPVYIESVSVNKQKQQLNQPLQLPQGAGELQVNYAGLTYLNPEKIRFRYRLDGFETGWTDAAGRRFAYYANLPPGHYRFSVMAGNVDGTWNPVPASFSFYLSPHFYQTRLFTAGMASSCIVLGWLLYRFRMHSLKARYSAVLAERNRISQDIHDTFAQNLTGIALQLDSMTMRLEEIPPGLRESIDEACNLTRYSLAEARRTMSDLRSDELESAGLTTALPEIASRMVAGGTVQTSVRVAGTPQRLSPVTEKNLTRIFQEAMANALKHAQARAIEIELRYDKQELTLRVRDDGRGFDAQTAIPLAVGHYGLTGMRERAERIGGRLDVISSPGRGTELIVVVPFSAQG